MKGKIVLADNLNNLGEQDSERFNSMLNAAQKQVGATQGGSSLTQAQIEAMLAVNDDDEDEDEDNEEAAEDESGIESEEADNASDEDNDIADKLREKISADSQEIAEEAEKKKKKKEKKPKVKKEKKPLDKAALAKILTAAAVIVALALGYCVCLLFFTDVIKTPSQEFAIKAAKAVDSKLSVGTEMYVYRAYVRNNSDSDECMIYAVTSSRDSEKTDMYHVVIYHDKPNKINVYYTLDTDNSEYIKMRDSDDEKQRVKASNLKHYSDEIAEADKEIQINDPKWEKIDSVVVNKYMKEETQQ